MPTILASFAASGNLDDLRLSLIDSALRTGGISWSCLASATPRWIYIYHTSIHMREIMTHVIYVFI